MAVGASGSVHNRGARPQSFHGRARSGSARDNFCNSVPRRIRTPARVKTSGAVPALFASRSSASSFLAVLVCLYRLLPKAREIADVLGSVENEPLGAGGDGFIMQVAEDHLPGAQE